MKKLTTEEFIERARKVHGDKYNYSKVNYVKNDIEVCIICPIHGDFLQTPKQHLRGQGCRKCFNDRQRKIKTLCFGEFVRKATLKHGNKYDYSKVDLEHRDEKGRVCIICKKHGEFWQIPSSHIYGYGCSKCANEATLNTEEFVKRAKEVHGNKYDYSKVKYINNKKEVCIICPIHGEFKQIAKSHLEGNGCNKCRESCLEHNIKIFLDDNLIKYEQQKRFVWLGRKSLDFYLPDYNVAIECQGIQHFKPIDFFGGEKKFIYQVESDKNKKKLCENNNIKIIYFTNVKDESANGAIHNIDEIKEKIIEYGSN